MPRVPMNVKGFSPERLRVPFREGPARVIGVVVGQILTEQLLIGLTEDRGTAVADVARDILKVAVIERHRGRVTSPSAS